MVETYTGASHTNAATYHPLNIATPTKVSTSGVDVFYGDKQALFDVTVDIPDRSVTSFIGPSGCGKSTFLRCINRMNDTIDGAKVTGSVRIDGEEVNARSVDPVVLRARVGMVFQKPNPFPKSIYDNVAYGPRIHGLAENKEEFDAIVETALRKAGLWEEVADRLDLPGTALSGGQQQRVFLARALAQGAELYLLDEPFAGVDAATEKAIITVLKALKAEGKTVVTVHHDLATVTEYFDRVLMINVRKIAEGRVAEGFTEATLQATYGGRLAAQHIDRLSLARA